MPDYSTLIAVLQWLVAGLAGLGVLVLMRRPSPRMPLAVNLMAVLLCLGVFLSLKRDGWTDLGDRVLAVSLGLLAFWLVLALLDRPWAEVLTRAGAWLYAGFFLAVGAASLRNDTPLSTGLAVGVMLFGLALLLVPVLARPRPGRIWALMAVVLLAAAVAAGSTEILRPALAP